MGHREAVDSIGPGLRIAGGKIDLEAAIPSDRAFTGSLKLPTFANQAAEDAAFAALPDGAHWWRSDLGKRITKIGSDREMRVVRKFYVDKYRRWNDTPSDSSAAFLRARDAAEAQYGTETYVNPLGATVGAFAGEIVFDGVRKLSETLSIQRGITLRGVGRGAVMKFEPTNVASNGIEFGIDDYAGYVGGGGDHTYHNWSGAGCRDFLLVGGSNAASLTGIGIAFYTVIYGHVSRVSIQRWGGSGTGARAFAVDNASQHLDIHNLYCSGDIGFHAADAIATVAKNLMVDNCTTYGAKISAAQQFVWDGGLVQGNIPIGVYIYPESPHGIASNEVVILRGGIHFELGGPVTDAIKATKSGSNTNTGFTFENCAFGGSAAHTKINLDGVQHPRILGNVHKWSGADVLLKMRFCNNYQVIGGHECSISSGSTIDVDATNTGVWIGAGAIGLNTSYCPVVGTGLQAGPLANATNALALRGNGGVALREYPPANEPATCLPFDVVIDSTDLMIKECTGAGGSAGGSGRGTWRYLADHSRATGITAGTTQTQAGATALVADVNVIATVGTTNDGVKLRSAALLREQIVINEGANTAKIYPASGQDLGAGTDTAITLAAGAVKRFLPVTNTRWVAS